MSIRPSACAADRGWFRSGEPCTAGSGALLSRRAGTGIVKAGLPQRRVLRVAETISSDVSERLAAAGEVTVPGARRGDCADASLDTNSIPFVLDCQV